MEDLSQWNKNRGFIRSRKGGWRLGRGVYTHGYEINTELMGNASFFQVLILNATGRLVERRLADWFEAIHIGLSWPDPRVWCNHIGALGGTSRASVVAATTAGILAADSRLYGQGTLLEGMDLIQRALVEENKGVPVLEIVQAECRRYGGKPKFMGYSRPVAKGDERISAIEIVREKLGFEIGKHLLLAFSIEKVLTEKFGEFMNFNGYISAFLSDQGFTGQEAYQICAVLVASGVTACYVDALERPAGFFLPMHCKDVVYTGPASRRVPDVE